VWDSWLQQTAQNGVYLANEEHFLVPGAEPAKIEAQLKAPVQQKSHGPGAVPASITADVPQAGSNVASQHVQRSGDLSAATCDGAAQRVASVGPAGHPKNPQIQALDTGLQRGVLANSTGPTPATSSLMPTR
jgi:hypothetical protein